MRRVHGGEAAEAAEQVGIALARWHEQGEATAGLAFWRQQLRGFHSPKAFALVVDALLRKHDFRASLALLMSWLSQAEQVPLEDGDFSFHALTLRWLVSATAKDAGTDFGLIQKFFDYLEANAEENWEVPRLESAEVPDEDEEEEDPYRAAYEDVTYEDSTDDGQEGGVIDDGPIGKEFDLEMDARRLEKRLRFLSTVVRLWEIAARQEPADTTALREVFAAWLSRARHNRQRLSGLLDSIHESPIPQSLGTHESNIEYDRRRLLKEQLLEAAIGTCLDTTLAVRALQGTQDAPAEQTAEPSWEPLALRLEQALLRGDADAVRSNLTPFLQAFKSEPLRFVPLVSGGHPAGILRGRVAQAVLQTLVEQMPRLGLLRETFHLLRTARAMEETQKDPGRKVSKITEFDRLFQLGFQGVLECVVESSSGWEGAAATDRGLVSLLETVTAPFLRLWVDYSRPISLSSLDRIGGAEQWQALRTFIERYGNDLFRADFMALANLRGVLHRGVAAYLDDLREHADPEKQVRLLTDLDGNLARDQAVEALNRILRAVVENYEEYKDYKTSTTQSDYGANLFVLLDFLRLKSSYDRHAWHFRPLVLGHEVLARAGHGTAAPMWQDGVTELTAPAGRAASAGSGPAGEGTRRAAANSGRSRAGALREAVGPGPPLCAGDPGDGGFASGRRRRGAGSLPGRVAGPRRNADGRRPGRAAVAAPPATRGAACPGRADGHRRSDAQTLRRAAREADPGGGAPAARRMGAAVA